MKRAYALVCFLTGLLFSVATIYMLAREASLAAFGKRVEATVEQGVRFGRNASGGRLITVRADGQSFVLGVTPLDKKNERGLNAGDRVEIVYLSTPGLEHFALAQLLDRLDPGFTPHLVQPSSNPGRWFIALSCFVFAVISLLAARRTVRRILLDDLGAP